MVKKRKPNKGVYCVIGVNAPGFDNGNLCKRRWLDTQDEAAGHAGNLIAYKTSRNMKVNRLLVVKVVEVIELSAPPITRRTNVTRGDVSCGEDTTQGTL